MRRTSEALGQVTPRRGENRLDANWRIGRGRPVMEIGKRVQVIGGLALTVCLASVALAQSDAAVAPPAAEPAPEGFFSIIFSGGWVGFLIVMVLFGLSLTAAYLVFEHIMTLRRGEIMPDQLGEQVRQLLAAGRVGEADQACRAQPSFLSFIVLSGLAEIEGGWPAVEKALEDATAEQSARLFRKIEYLSVIGNIAPMVGLLGTVTGMIFAFQQVASTQGSAGAGELAEGIYQALVTTVGGLLVAIPSLAAFAIFRNRVDQLVAEAAYQALHAFAPLKRRRVGKPVTATPPAPPPVQGGS
ncbi:MAG: MotA/TolQ/ExbB proton channel family protein [Pirellulaceae bacterium]|nr:MotA/TolQ/ExbB proton channel family protein [Planctomycetales bacterium]MCA9202912.1 MotA/TolQ/ExbB proton channel family protein [Planctomycetales bacterium]